jgi:hypothetical protein
LWCGGIVGTPIPQKRNRGQIWGIVGDFMSRYVFDTREKRNEHIKAYFDKHGIEYEVNRSYQLAETALFVRPGSTLQYKIIRLGESMTVDFTFSEENFVNID